ncbi:MAG TPA: helix-turn-helix domain-containing protein [Thermoanaerobaculia bacterium]|nr:helix-turn-helix domain-containing protein [Thermoanaerobaculia bacterium]
MQNGVGRVIREAREKQGLSQERLASLAGISRRQLATVELGGNTSLRILRKLARALDLDEIPIGDFTLTDRQESPGAGDSRLLTQLASAESSIRTAQAKLNEIQAAIGRPRGRRDPGHGSIIAERPAEAWSDDHIVEVPLFAELSPGRPLRYSDGLIRASIPARAIDSGETVIRFRGNELEPEGIAEGDLLVVELRPDGNAATGELVVIVVSGEALVGRWWNKRGSIEIRAPRSATPLRSIASGEPHLILGAVTEIVRGKSRRRRKQKRASTE